MSMQGATTERRGARPGWIPRDSWLLLVYLLPPTAWSGHLLFAYLFVSYLCPWGGNFAVRAEIATLTFLTLCLIATCGWIGYAHTREYGANVLSPDEVKSRTRGFLAHSAVYTAALFFIATLFEAAPAFALNTCGLSR